KNVCHFAFEVTVGRSKAAQYSCCVPPFRSKRVAKVTPFFLSASLSEKLFFRSNLRKQFVFQLSPRPVEAGCKGNCLFAFSKNPGRKSFSLFSSFPAPRARFLVRKRVAKVSRCSAFFQEPDRKKFCGFSSGTAPPVEAGCKGSNFLLTCATPAANFFFTGPFRWKAVGD
ncbi:hypothetical protein, partial [Hymenobacter pini]|uniref:hypothetical protein n=1 Tax=Hymenobacter pini TaxID=2880879 RepID=UPI001CF57068